MKHHYHVLNSFSGCLPETSYYCETKKDAITLAKSEARDYRDAEFYVAGNAEGGYEVKQNKDSYGGIYITIERCTESCTNDDY